MMNEELKEFYFTFTQRQRLLKNAYLRIHATNEGVAREYMMDNFEDRWAFCYGKDSFVKEGDYYTLHELAHVVLDSAGNVMNEKRHWEK